MVNWARRIFILLLLVGAAVAAWFLWLRADPVPVVVSTVEIGLVEETVTNSKAGTVKSRRRAALSPEAGGRIARIPVREGDRVEEGALLLLLSDSEQRAQADVQARAVATAEAARKEACINAEQARREYVRARQLAVDRIVSEERLEQARMRDDAAASGCEAAAARVAQARAALALAQVAVGKTAVHAPFAGVVAEVRAEVGEFIAPQMPGVFMQPVIDLIDPDDLYVSAPLDEVDVARVHAGLPVRITLDANADEPWRGTVTRVAPYVEELREQSRTFEVEVALGDVPEGFVLKPGATADIEVILTARENVLRIPAHALVEGGRVLVVRDGRLVSVPVTAGLRNWEYVEVTSGLSAGDQIVVSLDRAEVKEGARVTVSVVDEESAR